MKDWVQQRLSSGPHDPDQVNAVLMEAAATYFPRSRSEGKPESAQHRATLRMWHRVQQIRSLHEESVTTLADLEQSLEDLSTRSDVFGQQSLRDDRKGGDSVLKGRVLRKDRLHVVAKELQLSWCIQQVAIWPLQLGFDLWGPRPELFERFVRDVGVMVCTGLIYLSLKGSMPLLAGEVRPHKAVLQGSAPAAAWRLCSDLVGEH